MNEGFYVILGILIVWLSLASDVGGVTTVQTGSLSYTVYSVHSVALISVISYTAFNNFCFLLFLATYNFHVGHGFVQETIKLNHLLQN